MDVTNIVGIFRFAVRTSRWAVGFDWKFDDTERGRLYS